MAQSIILENDDGDKCEIYFGNDGWLYFGQVGGPYNSKINVLQH